MDIKEGLVEIDPGDIDQLASCPVRFSSESSNDKETNTTRTSPTDDGYGDQERRDL